MTSKLSYVSHRLYLAHKGFCYDLLVGLRRLLGSGDRRLSLYSLMSL